MLKELGYAGVGHLWFDNVAERLATLDRTGLKLFQIYMQIDFGPRAKAPYHPRLKRILSLIEGRDVQLAALVSGGQPSDQALDERAISVAPRAPTQPSRAASNWRSTRTRRTGSRRCRTPSAWPANPANPPPTSESFRATGAASRAWS
jgi:hypothetical protein